VRSFRVDAASGGCSGASTSVWGSITLAGRLGRSMTSKGLGVAQFVLLAGDRRTGAVCSCLLRRSDSEWLVFRWESTLFWGAVNDDGDLCRSSRQSLVDRYWTGVASSWETSKRRAATAQTAAGS
jgi:hypothetical protein